MTSELNTPSHRSTFSTAHFVASIRLVRELASQSEQRFININEPFTKVLLMSLISKPACSWQSSRETLENVKLDRDYFWYSSPSGITQIWGMRRIGPRCAVSVPDAPYRPQMRRIGPRCAVSAPDAPYRPQVRRIGPRCAVSAPDAPYRPQMRRIGPTDTAHLGPIRRIWDRYGASDCA